MHVYTDCHKRRKENQKHAVGISWPLKSECTGSRADAFAMGLREEFSNDCRKQLRDCYAWWLARKATQSRKFSNQWEAKPKLIPRSFPRDFSELQVIARNFDCFIALFALVVIWYSNYFDICIPLNSKMIQSLCSIKRRLGPHSGGMDVEFSRW